MRREAHSAATYHLAAGALLAAIVLAACETPDRLEAVPPTLTTEAVPSAGDRLRFRAPGDITIMAAEGIASVRRERAYLDSIGETGPLPPVSFLALSGGSDQGAFAAGFLKGWTESGSRPSFKVVTGVSTGALIAPFAFLGPQYDYVAQDAYTNVSQEDIYIRRGLLAALFGDGLVDPAPMRRLVERHVTRQLLDAIAAEYQKGRFLLVGTTDLDARQPVIWNMTAIANSADPDALELFRSIILASVSIPALFPPVMMDVTVEGRRFQEMHVDGGATTQVFLYPPGLQLVDIAQAAGVQQRQRTLYIIRNAQMASDWTNVERRTLPIASRAVSSLIQTQGIGDLAQIYLTSRRDGIDYNLIYIPKEFDAPHPAEFDTTYMRALFEYGRAMAAGRPIWHNLPPGYELPEVTTDLAVAP